MLRLNDSLWRNYYATGPAYLTEGDELLVVDQWCYLGAARSDEELWPLLDTRRPQFDRDTYRILSKVVGRMRPVARHLLRA